MLRADTGGGERGGGARALIVRYNSGERNFSRRDVKESGGRELREADRERAGNRGGRCGEATRSGEERGGPGVWAREAERRSRGGAREVEHFKFARVLVKRRH